MTFALLGLRRIFVVHISPYIGLVLDSEVPEWGVKTRVQKSSVLGVIEATRAQCGFGSGARQTPLVYGDVRALPQLLHSCRRLPTLPDQVCGF